MELQKWDRFFKITLPQITPVIITIALLSAIWTFNSFEVIYILTEGGPRGATTTLIIDTYKMALGNYKFGKGAARAVIVVILLTIFSAFYMTVLLKINKKVSHEYNTLLFIRVFMYLRNTCLYDFYSFTFY